jgi:hypothetical protein
MELILSGHPVLDVPCLRLPLVVDVVVVVVVVVVVDKVGGGGGRSSFEAAAEEGVGGRVSIFGGGLLVVRLGCGWWGPATPHQN